MRFLLLIVALLFGAACADSAPRSVDDDDDVTLDDDDVPLPEIDSATFAVSMQGDFVTETEPLIQLRGSFHTLYWGPETDGPVCRLVHEFSGWSIFQEVGVSEHCPACTGSLTLERARPMRLEGPDGCAELPSTVDLGFLLDAESEVRDLRAVTLVSADALHDDVELGTDLTTAGVEEAYAAAGFEVVYYGLVDIESWLARSAGLGAAALPWGEASGLPMFVVYREFPVIDRFLTGETRMASLWTIGLEDASPTNE